MGAKSAPPELVLEAGPPTPPWPPQDILKHRVAYMSQICARPPRAIIGTSRDTPLHSLYRIYEYLVLDDHIGYRNEIEYFWKKAGRPVTDIPDPQDPDPSLYAFLAGILQLLVYAFNSKIKIGLRRDLPAIISPEEAEILRSTPENEKVYESVPQWSLQVKPLKKVLIIPMLEGEGSVLPTDEIVDREFLKLNIRIGEPHVLFT
jgi:hypothetical protein